MTQGVVTADADDTLGTWASSCATATSAPWWSWTRGRPVGVITDRDLALAVVADGVDAGTRRRACLATDRDGRGRDGHRGGGRAHGPAPHPPAAGASTTASSSGIVTIDDLAVRAGDLHQAQQITAEVAKAALPEFYFHQRGG